MSKKNKKKQPKRAGLDPETERRLSFLRGLPNGLMDRSTSKAIRLRLCELKLAGTTDTQEEAVRYLEDHGEFTPTQINMFHREDVESLTLRDIRAEVRQKIIEGQAIETVTQWALKQPHPLMTSKQRQEHHYRILRLVALENTRIQDYEGEVLLDIRRVASYEDDATPEKVEQRVVDARRKHFLVLGTVEEAPSLNLVQRFFKEDVGALDIEEAIEKAILYLRDQTRQGTPEVEALKEAIETFADDVQVRIFDKALAKPDVFKNSKHTELRQMRFQDPDVQNRLKAISSTLPLEERLRYLLHLNMTVDSSVDDSIDMDMLEDRYRSRNRSGTSWVVDFANIRRNPKATDEEKTVEIYMTAMSIVFFLSRHGENKKGTIHLWRLLQEAKIFHFDPQTYLGIHREADRYTTESLAGLNYLSSGVGHPTEDETSHLLDTIYYGAKKVPFPEKLPFPVVFFGYGDGLDLSQEALSMKAPPELKAKVVRGSFVGHLLSDTGHAFVFHIVTIHDERGARESFWVESCRTDDSRFWVPSDVALEPWILTSLVDIINDHRTFMLESYVTGQQRARYKDERKTMGLKPNSPAYTPPPFYKLKLTSKVIQEKVRLGFSRPRLPVSYRTDVRAHERCRIRRGILPIDPEVAADLTKRGYRIFGNNPLDADTLRRLYERGVPFKRSDEWLAIKVSWVREHFTSNDPNLPYVPATRVCGKVRVKAKNIDSSWRFDPAST